MINGADDVLPVEKPVCLGNRHIVDAGMALHHQPVSFELPVLIAIGAEPLSVAVVVLIGKALGDAIAGDPAA